ncbi:acyltransferase family protein [Tropicimonas isoalkanivorans]|uniref:Peptidoglycan/LPS O-acetylase OafA/YrhL, contains acyltransferase and SGNH-hydrolase domains n=1 Tax=Tropicimonas isoalkanivorans TaxID=441112 RepID=A0A1I1LDY4_9RHOB|nr:acyltransferase [Tropicimonas isoalkanivorans]SFC71377.1 Peptidoglycan/LPS O-acetylase OafA/YrhL, contains acyltransferase and SGNH-hydrolase domains [Tropicimonas isoalkanivorans]
MTPRTGGTEVTGWTALRGIAALWVVLFHYRDRFTPRLDSQIFTSGYLGVELFFVLSGSVLYYVYRTEFTSGRFDYSDFLIKRLARLYPVHLVTMVAAAAIIFGLPIVGFREPPPYGLGEALAVDGLMLQSFPIIGRLSLNYPSWSISAEFLAYLIFPLCLAVVLRTTLIRAALLAIILFFVCEVLATRVTGSAFDLNLALTRLTYNYSVLRVVPEFFLGVLMAAATLRYQAKLAPYATPVMIVSTIGLVASAMIGNDLLFILCVGPLVSSLLLFQGRFPAPLVWLGRISYSLYMSHVVVKMVLMGTMERVGGYSDGNMPVALMPLAVGIAIGCAAVLYYVVEKPGQRETLRRLRLLRADPVRVRR